MTLKGFWTMLIKWRWIVVIGLVVGLGAGGAMFVISPRSYSFKATYLLLSPLKSADGKIGNPFLDLGNGVTSLGDLLAVSLSDADTAQSFASTAPKLKYSVIRDTSIGAPLIMFEVIDLRESNANHVLDELTSLLSERLSTLQRSAGAPVEMWVTTTQLSRDTKPEVSSSTALRNGMLAFGGSLTVALLLVSQLERRRNRRWLTDAESPDANSASVRVDAETIKVFRPKGVLVTNTKRKAPPVNIDVKRGGLPPAHNSKFDSDTTRRSDGRAKTPPERSAATRP